MLSCYISNVLVCYKENKVARNFIGAYISSALAIPLFCFGRNFKNDWWWQKVCLFESIFSFWLGTKYIELNRFTGIVTIRATSCIHEMIWNPIWQIMICSKLNKKNRKPSISNSNQMYQFFLNCYFWIVFINNHRIGWL